MLPQQAMIACVRALCQHDDRLDAAMLADLGLQLDITLPDDDLLVRIGGLVQIE